MKRLIFFSIVALIYALVPAQIMKERRVYYLDCSYSMETNGIWNNVRDNLKKAIDNVNDETTELMVIPFADNSSPNPTLKPMREFATAAGKSKLKSQIDGLPMNKKTMTYHHIPISDFYNNRVDNNRVTYMFLMTDGHDEDKQQKALRQLLPQWGQKYGNRNVYGFYVMLDKKATNPAIDNVVKSQDHLWKVETADVNINLVRLQSNAIFNAKNDHYFDLPVYGNASGKSFNASFPANCPYKVRKVEKISKSLRIWVDTLSGQKLPVSMAYPLNVAMSGGDDFDFLVTEKVYVKCEFKPERSLKITVR